MDTITVSYPLAFLAGLVSFLSPCVLPVVPGYITFVSGLTLEDLQDGSRADARRTAALHSALFILGFGLVFMTLGAGVGAMGGALGRGLPWLSRVGGILVALFGVHLLGVIRVPALAREVRVHLTSRPAGALGSVVVGAAFAAGWTPCVGPILASILLWAGLEATAVQGSLLLGAYALGLAVPFFGAALAFGWFLAGSGAAKRWLGLLERTAGVFLIVLGLMMVTGHFTALTAALADMGQLITLEF